MLSVAIFTHKRGSFKGTNGLIYWEIPKLLNLMSQSFNLGTLSWAHNITLTTPKSLFIEEKSPFGLISMSL